jgi:nuclear GTP-binding protein
MHKHGIPEKLSDQIMDSSKTMGADALMNMVKNYMRSEGPMTIGVIGYPNVGKSSIINSLKRNRAVGVSSRPGYTKHLQEVELEKKLKIIDCPGVIFNATDEPSKALLNVARIESLNDPLPAVQGILDKTGPHILAELYGIDEGWPDIMGFLGSIARKRGKYIRTGVPNFDGVSRMVLQDWVTGRIPYYVVPEGYMEIE